ncbi:NADH pyrophosphatase (plasmid) [Burkholderia sp. SFA1]|uniref:NAD(+) diphosphatase n=1 Tax=unclassified Caballeronia TaxID=2646786 RepID=UPI001F1BD43A|nr:MULTISPECIES: NAD(+) diphosphatase [unclassified Caballeronia]MCE4546298.1 NAD(+) diphosphatase [Caballeronia sp. PC1]MCE4573227.1 NAD(+) diphosphatase [Caballeronia sp. CLC5]BBQ01583.1 NADH pyrophosphatase [Burkholderia sp. SFA1]
MPTPPHAIGFTLDPLDRVSEKRDDDGFVAGLSADPATRFLLFVNNVPLFKRAGGHDPLFSAQEAATLGAPLQTVFLGRDAQARALFALSFDSGAQSLPEESAIEAIELRPIAMQGLVSPPMVSALGEARSMLDWHRRHRFCANCGQPTDSGGAGWRRICANCKAQHFPRVDPVVIMLVTDGERCLLGRQPQFLPGMYSALAGFVEPGETFEHAVYREVLEEAGIRCTDVRYYASQPWPFPSSLMIGCFARAASTEIVVDKNELEDARWFTRKEVGAMLDGTHEHGLSAPKPFAIAHHLLKAFATGELD